jgi:hypothetical protein
MNFKVKSWCPGDNCDPCTFRPAFSYAVFNETFTTSVTYQVFDPNTGWGSITENMISGGHVRYNFGRTFYPIALPVYETIPRLPGPSLDYSIPARYIAGDTNAGEGPQSFNVASYWEDVSTLTIQFMGEIIYQTNLALIRHFYGGTTPQTYVFSDGGQVNYDPHDIISVAPNSFAGGVSHAVADLSNTALTIEQLQPGVLYYAYLLDRPFSFVIATNPDGTPDRSALLMEGFVYNGPYDPSQDIIFDVWIQSLSPIGPGESPHSTGAGYRRAFFGYNNSPFLLWYRGPNPFF